MVAIQTIKTNFWLHFTYILLLIFTFVHTFNEWLFHSFIHFFHSIYLLSFYAFLVKERVLQLIAQSFMRLFRRFVSFVIPSNIRLSFYWFDRFESNKRWINEINKSHKRYDKYFIYSQFKQFNWMNKQRKIHFCSKGVQTTINICRTEFDLQ